MALPPKIRVQPVEGHRVMRHDATFRPITAECEVPWHPHYIRAIARGELVEVKKKKAQTRGKKED